jgi:hypothetical protein
VGKTSLAKIIAKKDADIDGEITSHDITTILYS